jgi:hypothetical protein
MQAKGLLYFQHALRSAPSLSRLYLGFRSLWTMFFSWAASMPSMSCSMSGKASSKSSGPRSTIVERGNGTGFARETLGELLFGNLDGDVAIQPMIAGSIHFTHAPRANGRKDFIRTEFLSGRERHKDFRTSLSIKSIRPEDVKDRRGSPPTLDNPQTRKGPMNLNGKAHCATVAWGCLGCSPTLA